MASFDLVGLAGSIKSLATVLSLIVIGYSGFILISSDDLVKREDAKQIIKYVFIGLSIIWIVPLLVNLLSGGTYCGV
ncbi:Uncharacterised protein [uncultured archaeon]|nr:Uncharacterised protein [uncultured archaeon]